MPVAVICTVTLYKGAVLAKYAGRQASVAFLIQTVVVIKMCYEVRIEEKHHVRLSSVKAIWSLLQDETCLPQMRR